MKIRTQKFESLHGGQPCWAVWLVLDGQVYQQKVYKRCDDTYVVRCKDWVSVNDADNFRMETPFGYFPAPIDTPAEI